MGGGGEWNKWDLREINAAHNTSGGVTMISDCWHLTRGQGSDGEDYLSYGVFSFQTVTQKVAIRRVCLLRKHH